MHIPMTSVASGQTQPVMSHAGGSMMLKIRACPADAVLHPEIAQHAHDQPQFLITADPPNHASFLGGKACAVCLFTRETP